jgi:uncharacterized protein (TIGR02271 family)
MASTNQGTQGTQGTVVAYFNSEIQAERAVRALQDANFSSRQIGIALSKKGPSSTGGIGTGGATGVGTTTGYSGGSAGGTKKKEGAWDKLKDFFGVDSGVEPYADEKERNPAAAHEITDVDSYRYEQEDVSHSLSGMSVPEERSRYFGHRLASTEGAIVTVTAKDRAAEAERILEAEGGDLGAGAADYDYSSQSQTVEGLQKIQLLGEVLRVHRDRVQRGEVRVRKGVVTEQQTVQVPVTREELVIERVPVSGQALPTTGEIGAESEIRIPLTEEKASLDKQTVVREQVNVGKRAVEDVEHLKDSVRHEELDVKDETKAR